ncbi:MAG: UDP-N-acetylmuramoyl-tripeptide--D-alanyl-D-alanine ligase [Bacillota bacterium]
MFKIDELVNILDCKLHKINLDLKKEIKNISTDTRKINSQELFIPLKGQNFDGHDFINKAFEKGALLTLSEKLVDYPALIVEDTKKAYYKIAKYYRDKIDPLIIGITGSVGKTTTKEFIYNVLKNKYNVLKTYKNYNNKIGVAKTLLNLKKDTDILVLEMGIDYYGEMKVLSKMAKPNYVVLTNIGLSHVGNFNSKDEIVKAKFQIFDYASDNCIAIYNGDDPQLNRSINKINFNKFSFGYKNENDIVCKKMVSSGIDGNNIELEYNNLSYYFETLAIGQHISYSILPAVLLGILLNIKEKDIIEGIETYKDTDKRMEVVKTDDFTIIKDCYNASLESTKSALKTLINSKYNKKVAFLGDILELGKYSELVHKEIGNFLKTIKIDKVFLVGSEMKYAYNESKDFLDVNYYKNKDELKKEIDIASLQDNLILLKGSRGMEMEKIIDFLSSQKG